MRLCVRQMEPGDVNHCVAMLAADPEEQRRYGAQLEQLSTAWLKLLRTGSLNTTVIEDTSNPRPVAFGVSVFIADEFLHELKAVPRRWIGPTLTNRVHSTIPGILAPVQIPQANSSSGLNLTIWSGVVSVAPDVGPMMHVELWRGFFEAHRGFQIKEIICQPLDPQKIRASFQAGFFWLSDEGHYVDGQLQSFEELSESPFIMGGDRETANRAFGSWLSGLFAYNPPTMYLRPTEQRLLLAALRGLTDEELADELRISVSAVKKTWRGIYERTGSMWNGDLPDDRAEDSDGKRGKEKKQHFLSYLRAHMEELRPVLPPPPPVARERTSSMPPA